MEGTMNELTIKYFSARMLVTLDTNQLFHCLFEEFGECQVRFIPMTPDEKTEASREVDGINAVNERYWIFHRSDGDLVRRPDVEQRIVLLGQK
jgi:hypothetical protein